MKVNFVICMFMVGAVGMYPSNIFEQLPLAQTDSPGAGSPEDYGSDSGEQQDLKRSPIIASELPNAQTVPVDTNNSLNNDENQSLNKENQSLQGSETFSDAASNDKGRIVLPTLTAGGADKPEPTCHERAEWRKNYEELRESYIKLSLRYTNELIKHDDVATSGVHLNIGNGIRRLQCSSLDEKITQHLFCNVLN